MTTGPAPITGKDWQNHVEPRIMAEDLRALEQGIKQALDGGGGSGAVGVTADDTPVKPAEGQTVSYLVSADVVWPAGIIWSLEPDNGTTPTITGTGIVTFATVGGNTFGVLGSTYPAVDLVVTDTVAPVAGVLSVEPGAGSLTMQVTGASDETALHTQPYAFSVNDGVTWSPWQTSASRTVTGLPSTAHACRHKVRDAAGNETIGTAVTATPDEWDQLEVTFAGASPIGVDVVAGDGWSWTADLPVAHSATRKVILALNTRGGLDSSQVTADGTPAVKLVERAGAGAANEAATTSLWDISHVTGGQAAIQITGNPTWYTMAGAAWVVDGAESQVLQALAVPTTAREGTVTSAEGGVVIASTTRVVHRDYTDATPATWTGADEDYNLNRGSVYMQGASGPTSGATHTVQAEYESTDYAPGLCLLSIGPA